MPLNHGLRVKSLRGELIASTIGVAELGALLTDALEPGSAAAEVVLEQEPDPTMLQEVDEDEPDEDEEEMEEED